jgi:hypothetical protein
MRFRTDVTSYMMLGIEDRHDVEIEDRRDVGLEDD